MVCCTQTLQCSANMKSTIGIGWSTAPKQLCLDIFFTDEPGFACSHPRLFTGDHWHTEKGLQDPNPAKHVIRLLHCARCLSLQPRYGGGIWQQRSAKYLLQLVRNQQITPWAEQSGPRRPDLNNLAAFLRGQLALSKTF